MTTTGLDPLDAAALGSSFRAWLADHERELDPYRHSHPDTHEELVAAGQAMTRLLWDSGWKKYGWPESVGGYGGGPLARAAFYDELARAGLLIPETDLSLEVMGDPMLHFAPALAKRFLPAMLRGDEAWCQGFSEPDAGSDLASLRCRATPDGDGWIVNGQKTWTSNGHLSRRMALLARTGTAESRHRGISMFLVDLDLPGITVRPLCYANGQSELAEVFFDDVRVPADRLIAERDGGWGAAMYLLQFERGMYAWLRQAWMHSRLTSLAQQVRTAFRPGDTAVALALGSAYRDIAVARARAATTVRRLQAGETIGADASADKVLLAGAEQGLFDVARELLGAAFVTDSGLEQWRAQWFYTRAASIYGGSGEVQRTILADRVLKLPAEDGRRERKG